jgi:hypothetical protein
MPVYGHCVAHYASFLSKYFLWASQKTCVKNIFVLPLANALALAASGARGPDAAGNTAQADQPAVPGRAERSYIAFKLKLSPKQRAKPKTSLTAPKAVDGVAYITAELELIQTHITQKPMLRHLLSREKLKNMTQQSQWPCLTAFKKS